MTPSLVTWPTSITREAAPLGEADQLLRRAAHLADRAGRAVERVEIHRLDRIDDDEIRARRPRSSAATMSRTLLAAASRTGALGDAEPLGAQPHLIDRLLAGDVGARRAAALPRGERRGGLQQQGRFADARIAADQDRRAGHEAAAADAVELGDAGQRGAAAACSVPVRPTKSSARARRRRRSSAEALGRRLARHFLDRLFQAPQPSQRPAHLAWTAPHCWQTKRACDSRHVSAADRHPACPGGEAGTHGTCAR